MKKSDELTVCITGAAGQIAYSFIPQLMSGIVFPGAMINLKLHDLTIGQNILKGIAMEIIDCAYQATLSVRYGDNPKLMFRDADVIVFLGGFPRKQGMERKDLLEMNKDIFETQAKALSAAKPDVKCVVIANPANTNAAILAHFSKIKKQNITCLSRLDHNRAIGQIVEKTGAKIKEISGIYVFGNHSTTQYPCIHNIEVKGKKISQLVDREWLQNSFISKVQKRGGQILNIKNKSSVFSAAQGVIDHLHDWYQGSDNVISMGVQSDGSYGIPEGLWASLPVRCVGNFAYQIVKDIELSNFCKQKIKVTVKQLEEELKEAEIK